MEADGEYDGDGCSYFSSDNMVYCDCDESYTGFPDMTFNFGGKEHYLEPEFYLEWSEYYQDCTLFF